MTALCGGGASSTKPGVPEIVTVGAVAIESAIILLGFPELAAVLAPLVAAAPFETGAFCASDPPADPGLTQQIIFDAADVLNPLVSVPAQQKVSQWFYHQYWYTICECTSTATPAPPSPSNPGPTSTGANTGLPGPGPAPTCWTSSITLTAPPNASFHHATSDNTRQLCPAGAGYVTFTDPNVGAISTYGNVANWNPTGYDYTVTGDGPVTTGGAQYGMLITSYTSSPPTSVLAQADVTSTGTTTSSDSFAGSSGPLWVGAGGYNTDTVAHTFTFSWTWHCAGAALANQPCCPPDPILTNYVLQILGIVQNLQFNPPGTSTGWTDATVHSGLSGTGSFQLAAHVTGLRATFTSIPSSIRVTAGTPPFYWDLGFVTPVAAVVPLRSLRTVFASQDLPLPAQTTAIDYTFPAGVVVTLTELLPA